MASNGGGTVEEHSTTDPEIGGLNPAECQNLADRKVCSDEMMDVLCCCYAG